MSIRAGRVGVNPTDVDVNGHIKGSSDTYSKSQIDTKLSKKLNADKVGGLEFREEEGNAQYKLPDGEWTNFSGGGATPTLLWTNDNFTIRQEALYGVMNSDGNGNASPIVTDIDIDSYEYYAFLAVRISNSDVIKSFNVLSAETLKNCNNNARLFNSYWANSFSNTLRVDNNNKLVLPATSTSSGFLGVYKVWGLGDLGLDEQIF